MSVFKLLTFKSETMFLDNLQVSIFDTLIYVPSANCNIEWAVTIVPFSQRSDLGIVSDTKPTF